MQNNENNLEREVKRLLSPLREERTEPSPFLKTRILAQLRANRRRTLWRHFLLLPAGVGAAALLFLFVLPVGTGQSFQAVAHQPVAVKVDVSGLKDARIAHAAIELPRGVQFFSKRFPAVEKQASLRLAWTGPSSLPIVVQAGETGIKSLRVKFFDNDNHLVAERTLKIRFTASPNAMGERTAIL